MIYEIYVGNNLHTTELSIEDVMYYIIINGLSIIDENEDLDNNPIQINCEYKHQEVSI